MNHERKLAVSAHRGATPPRSCLYALLLPLLLVLLPLGGCFHHKAPPAPPVASGPPAQPTSMTQIPDLPQPLPDSAEPKVDLGKATATVTPPPTPKVHRAVRKKRVVDGPSTAPAASGAAAAGTAAPPAADPQNPGVPGAQAASKPPELGQLSAGNGADTKERSSMIEQIHALELRLAGLKHSQSGDEETTATNIRLFLFKARQATQANDLDGARTLALKAKVLLDELSDL